jgi:hypothetical protein
LVAYGFSVGVRALLAGSDGAAGAAGASKISPALTAGFVEPVDFLEDSDFGSSLDMKACDSELTLARGVLILEARLSGFSEVCDVAPSPRSFSFGAEFPVVFSPALCGGSGAAPWSPAGTFKRGAASFEAC